MVLGQGKVGSPAVSLVEETSGAEKAIQMQKKRRGDKIYAVIFSLFGIEGKTDFA